MRYFATIDENGLCIGFIQSERNVISTNDIEVTQAVSIGIPLDDFLWRKYENGAWSDAKFPPPTTEPGVPLEEQITTLKNRLSTTEQALSDTSLTTQQLLETLIDAGVI